MKNEVVETNEDFISNKIRKTDSLNICKRENASLL